MARKRNKEQLPDVDIVLTSKEQSVLLGESAELLKLYIIISRYRDFSTNIAGLKIKLSDRAFKEQMEITQRAGRTKWKPTTTHIQRWISQLENLGLIQHQGNYVFYCPFAYSPQSVKKISHQFVTNSVTNSVTEGVTEKEYLKTSEIPLENKDKSDIDKNKVSPILSPQVSPQVDQRLYTPLNKDLDMMRSDHAREEIKFPNDELQPFKDMFAEMGFSITHLLSPKLRAMLLEWLKAGVTLLDAKNGIAFANSAATGKIKAPWYYFEPVLTFKTAELSASTKAHEVTHAPGLRSSTQTQTYRSTYRPSSKDTLYDAYAKHKERERREQERLVAAPSKSEN